MADRPWLLIDVDGVLNPLVVREGFDVYELVPQGWNGPQLYVQLTPQHGEWLLELAHDFELAWATTWEDSANALIGPIVGLPELPVIHFGLEAARRVWGICQKTPGVERWVGKHPFAWLDDGISDLDADWLRRRGNVGDFHLQRIDPLVGLTPSDLEEVRNWAKGLAEPWVRF
jgi:hypothetical protein